MRAIPEGIKILYSSLVFLIMKISVVIATYRRPSLLLRCLKMLASQAFPKNEFEIIVVTDGPDATTTDAVKEFAHTIDCSIFCFSLNQKSGPAAARNFGWRHANGRLVLFTDDDCLPDSKWMLTYWNAFLRTTGSRCAFTGKTIVPIPEVPTDYERNISHLSTAEFITANCACTKAALEKVGGFDEQFEMAWREDSDLQFKLMESRIPIVRVPNAIVTHPVRQAPWGVSIKEEKKGMYNALLLKKFPSLYKQRIESSPPWNYFSIVFCLLFFLIGLLLNNFWIALGSLGLWFVLTLSFALKRLADTSHSGKHVAEMLFTSAVIPVLSLYYRIYGAIKFKAPLFP
jgi:glycosyltransferase involved in cell wall biosynthesis